MPLNLSGRGNVKSKPYKTTQKKPDQSYKNLIYTPTAQAPNTGPGMAFTSSNPVKSPPPLDYVNSPLVRNDFSDDSNNQRTNFKANVGHGDLGMSGLSGSRGADLNVGSKGNLQEAGLDFPPLPPRLADPNRYPDNHDGPGQKRGRQNHNKSVSPPPPPSYMDPVRKPL